MQIDIERLRNFVRERDAAGAASRLAGDILQARRDTFSSAQADADTNAAARPDIQSRQEGEAHRRRVADLVRQADDARQRLALAREEQQRASESFSHLSRICARALEYARSLPNVSLPADLARDDF